MALPSLRGVLTPRTSLFLDFDGTLASLADDPASVHLPDGGGALLLRLGARLSGALAVVSGRDVRDLARRTPGGIWRAGNHGDLIMAPGAAEPAIVGAPPADLVAGIERCIAPHPGVRLERKARVLAVHTRLARAHHADVSACLGQLAGAWPDYRLQRGKDIIEFKPDGVHKGAAIERLMALAPFSGRSPLFIGDDTTDEDGFRVALALNGSAIKVGEGDTLAPHRLSGPTEVWQFLEEAENDLT